MDPTVHLPDWPDHSAALRRVARTLLAHEADCDDVVQSVFLTAVEKPPRVLSRSWLVTTLRRRVIDRFRRNATTHVHKSSLPQPDPAPPTDSIVEKLEAHESLARALRTLREPYRETVYLRYFENLPPREIAARFDVPVKTVKTRLSRALVELRGKLSADFDGEGRSWQAALLAIAVGPGELAAAAGAIAGGSSTFSVFGGIEIVRRVVILAAVLLVGLGVWGVSALLSGPDSESPPPGAAPAPVTASLDAIEHDTQPSTTAAEADTVSRTDVQAKPSGAPVVDDPSTGSLVVVVSWSDDERAPDVGVDLITSTEGAPRIPVGRSVTDEDGRALFRGLAPGHYSARTDRGARGKAEVVAAEQAEIDVTLDEGVDVDGIVVDSNGQSIADAGIWLTNGWTNWIGGRVVARSAKDGRFSVRGVKPSCSLGALAEHFAPSQLVDLEEVSPTELRLVVSGRGAVLSGRVLGPDGDPVVGALVAVGRAPGHFEMRTGGGVKESWTPLTTRTDAEGFYRFRGVKPGDHPVAAYGKGFPVWYGEQTLVVETPAELDIRLEAPVTLRGTVRDEEGEPIAGAIVRAFPERIRESFQQAGQFDFDTAIGHPFSIADDYGRYVLREHSGGPTIAYATRGGRRKWQESIMRARLLLDAKPGETIDWDPVIEPGHVIQGYITYLDGSPMGNVFVNLTQTESGKQEVLHANKDGRFTFYNVEDVQHTMSVQLWNKPKDADPLEKGNVWPDRGDVHLRASFDVVKSKENGIVKVRLDDAGGRVPPKATPGMILKSDKGFWRMGPQKDGLEFTFKRLAPGRYRPIALVGDIAIAIGDWFDLAESEERHLDPLVTEPAGSARVRLLRDDSTRSIEATVRAAPTGSYQNVSEDVGLGNEVFWSNLSPGKYSLTVRGKGAGTVRHEFEVTSGVETAVEVKLLAAAMHHFLMELPNDRDLGSLTVKVIDPRDGSAYWSLTEERAVVLPRPYERRIQIPLGTWKFVAETTTGLRAEKTLQVRDLKPARTIRVTLR